jgi:hypothetical protein
MDDTLLISLMLSKYLKHIDQHKSVNMKKRVIFCDLGSPFNEHTYNSSPISSSVFRILE